MNLTSLFLKMTMKMYRNQGDKRRRSITKMIMMMKKKKFLINTVNIRECADLQEDLGRR